jgi:gas vesicle protein
MFGPDTSKWEEKAKSFGASAKQEAEKFFAAAKEKAGDVKQWFTDTFGRKKRDTMTDIKNAIGKEFDKLKDDAILIKYLVAKCVEQNPSENSLTCAVKMFGPDTSKWEEKAKSFGQNAKQEAEKWFAAAKDKAGDIKQWFSDTFGRKKRDTITDIKNAIGKEFDKLKDDALLIKYLVAQCVEKNPSENSVTCAVKMFGPDTSKWEEKAKSFGQNAKQEAEKWFAAAKDKAGDIKQWFTDTFGK